MEFSEELDDKWRELCHATKNALEIDGVHVGGTPYAQELAEIVAKKNGLPGFNQFIEWMNQEPQEPEKPSKDKIRRIFYENPPPIHDEIDLLYFTSRIEKELWDDYFDKYAIYEREMKTRSALISAYPPTLQGYFNFLRDKVKSFYRFFFVEYKKLPLSEHNRKRHTYIVGASGSGKSELIKNIFFHYLTRNTSTALVLIEPHGELSSQLAQWPELQSGRLAYIRPGQRGGITPVFNPLEISEEQRQDPKAVAVLVDEMIQVFAELLGSDLTTPMTLLLQSCFTVLFSMPGATLMDAIDFVDPEKNDHFIKHAQARQIGTPSMRAFIENDLNGTGYEYTRRALKTRLQFFLSKPFFNSFLVGKSSFHLDELLREKKAVIFNLAISDIGETESRIFGQFIIAHIKAFGFRQGKKEHPANLFSPVHLFVDECQNFITPSMATILEQLRKFGVHLTLAQQTIGQGMDKAITSAVLGNTAIKIIGKSSGDNYKKFASVTGADPETLKKLDAGNGVFCFVSNGVRPIIAKVSAGRLDESGSVSPEIWAHTWAQQVANYYTQEDAEKTRLAPQKTPSSTYQVAQGLPSNFDY